MQRAILRLPGLINKVFVKKTILFFNIVLKKGLGISSYWVRFEFAPSRGGIHFHAIVWHTKLSEQLHSLLNNVLKQFFDEMFREEFDDLFEGVDVTLQEFDGEDIEAKFETEEKVAVEKFPEVLAAFGLKVDALH